MTRAKAFTSIRHKLIMTVGALFIGFIVVLLLLNSFLLESYYISSLEDTFVEEARLMKNQANEPLDNRLVLIRERSGIMGYKYNMLNSNGDIILSSVSEFDLGMKTAFPKYKQDYIEDLMRKLSDGEYKYAVLKHPNKEQSQIIITMKHKESMIVISTQLEAVVGNAKVANDFFIIVSMTMLILILLVTYLLSKRLVQPILMLNDQVEEIAHLNFKTMYKGMRRDEIGQLGQNINRISVELKNRMNELNERNQMLEDDMVKQRRFLASIAHEFKSPVGIIKGYAESIKLNYYETECEKDEFTDYIVEEADRLSDLVKDIIMLAKLDQNQFQLELSKVNISLLVHSVLTKKEREFEEKDYQLDIKIEDDVTLILDERRMEQILLNLVDNALYHSSGEGDIMVQVIRHQDKVQLIITNPCEVISINQLRQLSRPFYRIEESRSRNTGGHGLGLTIVKSLVEAQGGEFMIDYLNGWFRISIIFYVEQTK